MYRVLKPFEFIEPTTLEEALEILSTNGAKAKVMAGGVGVAPAIANAIYDAIRVRMKDLPITPEKIVKALKTNESYCAHSEL